MEIERDDGPIFIGLMEHLRGHFLFAPGQGLVSDDVPGRDIHDRLINGVNGVFELGALFFKKVEYITSFSI